MATVNLQSLSIVSGDTFGNYTVTLNGIWSDILSYSSSVTIDTGLNVGSSYIIISLGTSPNFDWFAIGVPGNVTPAVGVTFTATATGSGTGTGLVQEFYATPYQVYFGAVEATLVTVISNNAISCVVPAHIEELVGVSLTNLVTGTTSLLADSFSFLNPGTTTLGSVRLQAQQRSDMVNSNFITKEEWNAYINASYYELYDILAQKFGNDYFVARPFTYTTQTNETLYPLPIDFYKLLGVEIQLNTGNPNSWVTLKNFNFIDRNRFSYPNIYTFYGITNLRYRLNGNNLMIMPLNQSGQTIRIWYIPRQNLLVTDGSIIDSVSGWEEYIVVDACIKALTKQESDCQVFLMQKAALLKRIEEAAENRDPGEATRVSDLKSINYGFGGGDGWNGNNTGGGW